MTLATRQEAVADLHRLIARLKAALELTDAEGIEWARYLGELLDRADQGSQPVEADILFDLQRACIDNEKDICTVSVIDWALSGGKWPVKRPLPSLRLVRSASTYTRHGSVFRRARLSDASREQLLRLMNNALGKSEDRLRTRLRPSSRRRCRMSGSIRPTRPSAPRSQKSSRKSSTASVPTGS